MTTTLFLVDVVIVVVVVIVAIRSETFVEKRPSDRSERAIEKMMRRRNQAVGGRCLSSSSSSSLYMLKAHTTVGESRVNFDFSIGSLSQDSGLDFEVLDVYDLPPEDEIETAATETTGQRSSSSSSRPEEPRSETRKPWRFSLTSSYLQPEAQRHRFQVAGSDITSSSTEAELRNQINRLLRGWFAPKSSRQEEVEEEEEANYGDDVVGYSRPSKRDQNRIYFSYLRRKPDLYLQVESPNGYGDWEEEEEEEEEEEGGNEERENGDKTVRFVLVLPPGFEFTVTHPALFRYLGIPDVDSPELGVRESKSEQGERYWTIYNNDNNETLVCAGISLTHVGFHREVDGISYPYIKDPANDAGDSPSSQPLYATRSYPDWRSNSLSFCFAPSSGFNSVHSIELAADENHPADPDTDVALDVLSQCLPLLLEEANLVSDLLTVVRSPNFKDNLVLTSKIDWPLRSGLFRDSGVPLLLKLGWNESSAASFRLSTRKNFVTFHSGYKHAEESYYTIRNYVSRYEIGPFSIVPNQPTNATAGDDNDNPVGAKTSKKAGKRAERDSPYYSGHRHSIGRSVLRTLAPYAIVTTGSDSCDYVNDKGFVHVLAYADDSGRLQANSYFSSRMGQDRLSINFLNSAFRDYVFRNRRLVCMLLRASPAVRPPWTRSLMKTIGDDLSL